MSLSIPKQKLFPSGFKSPAAAGSDWELVWSHTEQPPGENSETVALKLVQSDFAHQLGSPPPKPPPPPPSSPAALVLTANRESEERQNHTKPKKLNTAFQGSCTTAEVKAIRQGEGRAQAPLESPVPLHADRETSRVRQ